MPSQLLVIHVRETHNTLCEIAYSIAGIAVEIRQLYIKKAHCIQIIKRMEAGHSLHIERFTYYRDNTI